MKPKQFE